MEGRFIMKKTGIFYKVIAVVITLASLLTLFTACGVENPDTPNTDGSENDTLDISGYTIIRRDTSEKSVVSKTASLKNAIKETLGVDLAIKSDWYAPTNAPDPNAKEILVDQTNRQESADALAKLEEKEGDAYIIDITENKIVILGKTAHSICRGITYFIKNYVLTSQEGNGLDLSCGKSVIEDYNAIKNISVDGKLDMDVEVISTMFGVPEKNPSDLLGYSSNISDVHFPSVVELQYQENEEDNGTLIGAFCIIESALKNPMETLACIMESRDGGKNWEVIARPKETLSPGTGWAGSMAHIYELPAQVGDMPAGTLIYSSNSVNYEYSSHIGVWKSNDCGKTWKEISIVARGGGLGAGVWEPVMFYDNEYLYCFYSDDSNRQYDQRIVYKRSKDGIKWESVVEVCAFDNFEDRPGMPIITKMSNGEFFLVYEYVRPGHASKIYYKTTKDITNWNPSDIGTLVQMTSGANTYYLAAAPSCVWTPAGGECGTLFVTGQYQMGGVSQNSIFASFDYGKTWDIIENPLPYDKYTNYVPDVMWGYRPLMVLGADPSVIHYVNTTNIKATGKSQIQYAKLKIFE